MLGESGTVETEETEPSEDPLTEVAAEAVPEEAAEDLIREEPRGKEEVARPFGVVDGGMSGVTEEVNADDGAAEEKWDEAATKLDLAQAYLNMGDKAGARSIIDEVMKEGSPAQKTQAAELQAQLG